MKLLFISGSLLSVGTVVLFVLALLTALLVATTTAPLSSLAPLSVASSIRVL